MRMKSKKSAAVRNQQATPANGTALFVAPKTYHCSCFPSLRRSEDEAVLSCSFIHDNYNMNSISSNLFYIGYTLYKFNPLLYSVWCSINCCVPGWILYGSLPRRGCWAPRSEGVRRHDKYCI